MSETASFVDPVFLAHFGLSRQNVLEYFLHPLNPFRTSVHTSNEVLGMQGIDIGRLQQFGTNGVPLPPQAAEAEYNLALSRSTGEQYELLPPPTTITTADGYAQISPLYTIRHVFRTNPTTAKVLGIYYVLEGVIYKAPTVRALMKANVCRTLQGLSDACAALSKCARYLPSTGYTWMFEQQHIEEENPVALLHLMKKRKRRKILDHRRPGERTDAEEEGIRASEAIDQILVRLSKSDLVVGDKKTTTATTTTTDNAKGDSVTTETTLPIPLVEATKSVT
jgi:hypothetical protein